MWFKWRLLVASIWCGAELDFLVDFYSIRCGVFEGALLEM
jgi:hypothetical protein